MMLGDVHSNRFEIALQDRAGILRLGIAAHEDIKCRKVSFRPGVNTDMGFGQDCDTGDAAARGEVMQMDVQQGCSADSYRFAHRCFHMIKIIKPGSFPQIQDDMRTSELLTITDDEMIFGLGTI